MTTKIWRRIFFALVLFFSVVVYAGGEVPWPLAAQAPLTEESASGIWYVDIEDNKYIYNVEVVRGSEKWVLLRVSIIDGVTLNVLSQGEAFIWSKQRVDGDTEGDDFEVGSYVYMVPLDNTKSGFFIRLVELWEDGQVSLGISILHGYGSSKMDHGIGRVLTRDTLVCKAHPDGGDPDSDIVSCEVPYLDGPASTDSAVPEKGVH